MNLKNFLDADKILLGLTADSQQSVLEKLISPLAKADYVTEAEVFLKDLQQREGRSDNGNGEWSGDPSRPISGCQTPSTGHWLSW